MAIGLDLSSRDNINTINRYLQAIGTEKDILFIRIKQEGKTLAEFEDAQKVMKEEDILIKSYPVKLGVEPPGYLTIGFSKAKFNEKTGKIWKYTGIGFLLIVLFLVGTFLNAFFVKRKSPA